MWLWTKGGKGAASGARGKADREKSVLLDTKFRIGSVNKMFTAVATLIESDRSKLSQTIRSGKDPDRYPNTNVASN